MQNTEHGTVERLPPVGDIALAISAQYRKAITGVFEMIRFGAMLMDVDTSLTRETRKGCIQSGQSLKGWLESNCPEVNYKTALRFLHLAEQVQRHCKLPAKVPLTLALPAADGSFAAIADDQDLPVPPSRLRALQAEVLTLIDGKSARQLEFEFRADTPRGGDRRSGIAMTEEGKQVKRHEDARVVWTLLVDKLAEQARAYKSHLMLEADLASGLCDRLEFVQDALRAAAKQGRD